MKKVVIVADDYGLLPCINRGIEKAYLEGCVTEASLMIKADYALDALKNAKVKNILNVGIHVELIGDRDLGRPVKTSDYIELYKNNSEKEIENLAKQEIHEFEKLVGRPPTHITSHKGIHGNFKLLNVLVEYAKKNKIPVRKPNTDLEGDLEKSNYAAEMIIKRAGVQSTNHLIIHIKGNDSSLIKESIFSDLKKVKDTETAEVLTHPGYFDAVLLKKSSLNYERSRDLNMLLDQKFINSIKDIGFSIVNYKQLYD